jgi:hypothetical protein
MRRKKQREKEKGVRFWNTKGATIRYLDSDGMLYKIIFHSLHHRVQNGSGTHPASYPMGIRGSLGVKQPGREADHSPPSSAEVKK